MFLIIIIDALSDVADAAAAAGDAARDGDMQPPFSSHLGDA